MRAAVCRFHNAASAARNDRIVQVLHDARRERSRAFVMWASFLDPRGAKDGDGTRVFFNKRKRGLELRADALNAGADNLMRFFFREGRRKVAVAVSVDVGVHESIVRSRAMFCK